MLSPIIVIRLNLLHKFVSTIKHHLSRFSVRIIILLGRFIAISSSA